MNYPAFAPVVTGEENTFLSDVRAGLSQPVKTIPPKYFYDAEGSHLFDLICQTPEYYPTRTEIGILEQYGAQMVSLAGPSSLLIELGSGSAIKTPLLLRHLAEDAVYLPIDICAPHLHSSTQRLQTLFPTIRMHPIEADYTQLSAHQLLHYGHRRKVVFFPGSTIGNYTPGEARQLLRQLAQLAGTDGALLIGVDCKKSTATLNAAYNDAAGYTAAFNLNLLCRMQRELGAQLDLEGFSHRAYYNPVHGCVEMHLVSLRKQAISLGRDVFHFSADETLHTENSYKYTAAEFEQLAVAAGWVPKIRWSDPDGWFDVHYLSQSVSS